MKKDFTEILTNVEGRIPTGRARAITRKELVALTGLDDRSVRLAISRSELPIINLGYGYFIPDTNDEVDMIEMHAYVSQEHARIASLSEKINTKFANLETLYHENVHTEDNIVEINGDER